ncbi:MAG TPA: outer membrane protein assembly factor BamD [Polyangia bacterium]|nr:outer membrane protein assembly factor BamD [Polyangia bacterium]
MGENRQIVLLAVAAWALLALAGCKKTADAQSLLDYSLSAEALFEEALEQFDDEDCVDAEKIFQEVRRQFPYSRFAPLSDLRMADCQFIQGNHAAAAVAYQQFVRKHPTHEETHYAAFRRGLSFVQMIPGDWLITPPSHERDQSATRDARASLLGFLEAYPRSPYRERATGLLAEVVNALVRHEIYVAEFYRSRDQLKAAAVRLEGVRTSFPDASLVPDAMFLQAWTYLELDRLDAARRVLGEIIQFYPEHYQAKRAKDTLEHLDAKHGDENRGSDG